MQSLCVLLFAIKNLKKLLQKLLRLHADGYFPELRSSWIESVIRSLDKNFQDKTKAFPSVKVSKGHKKSGHNLTVPADFLKSFMPSIN